MRFSQNVTTGVPVRAPRALSPLRARSPPPPAPLLMPAASPPTALRMPGAGALGGRRCSGPCRDSPAASPGLSPRDPRRGRSPRAVWWRWRRGGAAGGRGSAAIGLRAAGGLSVVRRGWPRQPLAQPSAGMLPLGGCGALRVLIKAPRLPPV